MQEHYQKHVVRICGRCYPVQHFHKQHRILIVRSHSLLMEHSLSLLGLLKRATERFHSTEQMNSIYYIFPKVDKCEEMWVNQLTAYIYEF